MAKFEIFFDGEWLPAPTHGHYGAGLFAGWVEDDDYTDAGEAAEAWAREYDSYDDQTIAGKGEELTVAVREVGSDSKPVLFSLTGYFEPVYQASEVSDDADLSAANAQLIAGWDREYNEANPETETGDDAEPEDWDVVVVQAKWRKTQAEQGATTHTPAASVQGSGSP